MSANKTVNIYINQEHAERALTALQQKADKATAAIKKGEAAGKNMSKQWEQLAKVNGQIQELTDIMNGKMAPSLRMQADYVKKLRRELEGMSSDAPGYAAKFREFDKATKSLNTLRDSVNNVNKAMGNTPGRAQRMWDTIKGVAVGTIIGNTVQAATDKLIGYFQGMITGNAALADSFSDIEKATGLTANQVRKLNGELSQMDTRTKAKELREIAIGLGLLGEKVTTDAIANIDRIVVALGDEFGADAKNITTVLSILRNNLHDIKSGNYGDDVLKLGNALNVLGAEGLATAPVVVDIANRIAGVGQTFGMTSGQILGVAATMQELGIEAERGSTAYIKILQKMTSEVGTFAKVAKYAGVSQEEFVKLVNTDVVAAFMKVAEGARKAGKDNVTFGKILKDLDADGSGAGEMLSKLSANSELLTGKMNLATDALTRTDSITNEFNKKNNNLAASLEKIEKRMAAAFTNPEVATGISALVVWFGKLIGAIDSVAQAKFELETQREELRMLEETMLPLIDTYDKLRLKTDRSADEQMQLAEAFDAIAQKIPYAIADTDEYGKVIAISSEKARAFIRLQQEMLRIKNADAIQTTESEISKVEKKIRQTDSAIESLQQRISNGTNSLVPDLTEANRRMAEYSSKLMGLKGVLNELQGNPSGRNETSPLGKAFGFDRIPGRPTGSGTSKPAPTSPTNTNTYVSETDRKQAEQAAKAAEDKRKHIVEQIDLLNREVLAKAEDLAKHNRQLDEQEIAAVQNKYQKLLNDAVNFAAETAELNDLQRRELNNLFQAQFDRRSEKEYKDSLQANEDHYNQQRQIILQAYAAKKIDKVAFTQQMLALDKSEAQDRVVIATDYTASSKSAVKDLEQFKTAETKKGVDERNSIELQDANERLARAERNVLTAKKGTAKELNARKALLRERFEVETAEMDKHSAAYILKETEFNNAVDALRKQHWQNMVDQAAFAVQEVMGVMDAYFQYLNVQGQNELARDRKANDEKKKNLQKRLDDGLITQQQYQNEVNRLDEEQSRKEQEIRRREFNRSKAASLVQAAINTALAVTQAFAQFGPVVGAPLALLAGAAGAVQIGLISASKFPEYGKGGIADGPSHEQGGIHMVDSKTGQKKGELEGGEPILSTETYRQNRAAVDALLQSSMYGGGRRVDWLYKMPAPINMGSFRQAVSNNRMFGMGGIAPATAGAAGGSSAGGGGGYNDAVLFEMMGTIQELNRQLSGGIKAYTLLSEQQKQQKLYDQAKDAGTLRKAS